jgi:hypothetical protein
LSLSLLKIACGTPIPFGNEETESATAWTRSLWFAAPLQELKLKSTWRTRLKKSAVTVSCLIRKYGESDKGRVYLENIGLELLSPGELVSDWSGHLTQVRLQLEGTCIIRYLNPSSLCL